MSLIYEERVSDSPYIEKVTRGWTESTGSTIRPAETNWHMVFTRVNGNVYPLVVGPLAAAGIASWGEGAEILWLKFKLGVFMPHLPTKDMLDSETILPDASSQSFWLKSSTWQFPDFGNVETFVDKLAHEDVLVSDPLVKTVLEGQPQELSSRTVRHRFLRATGLTQSHIYQFERAQRAAILLQQGTSILDAVYEAGYFDQPHLTRSLKQFIGYTPAQIIRMSQPDDCRTVQDTIPLSEYDMDVLANIS
jgi:hypothetical protein